MVKGTNVHHNLDEFQPIHVRKGSRKQNLGQAIENNTPFIRKRKKSKAKFVITILILFTTYFLAPIRSNILILGIDYLPPRDAISRTDTNILVTVKPLKPYIGMLSVPRDLWVIIPGVGENRINTAYFFAEAEQIGTGPSATVEAFHQIFGISLKYYLVIDMEGLVKIIDVLGGIKVDLPSPMGGLPMGVSILDGNQALAFVRERYSADDFSRMMQGQFLIISLIKKISTPSGFIKIPWMLIESLRAVETNIPWWLIPHLSLAFLRSNSSGIANRTINREMVTPFTTSDGAQVLAPKWDVINPVLFEMFGE